MSSPYHPGLRACAPDGRTARLPPTFRSDSGLLACLLAFLSASFSQSAFAVCVVIASTISGIQPFKRQFVVIASRSSTATAPTVSHDGGHQVNRQGRVCDCIWQASNEQPGHLMRTASGDRARACSRQAPRQQAPDKASGSTTAADPAVPVDDNAPSAHEAAIPEEMARACLNRFRATSTRWSSEGHPPGRDVQSHVLLSCTKGVLRGLSAEHLRRFEHEPNERRKTGTSRSTWSRSLEAGVQSGGPALNVFRARFIARQKYSPNPTVGPCAVSFRVRSLLATESVIFRYRML